MTHNGKTMIWPQTIKHNNKVCVIDGKKFFPRTARELLEIQTFYYCHNLWSVSTRSRWQPLLVCNCTWTGFYGVWPKPYSCNTNDVNNTLRMGHLQCGSPGVSFEQSIAIHRRYKQTHACPIASLSVRFRKSF